MNTEKLKELLSDEKFCEQLFHLETSTQVQDLLKANGVELTVEQIDTVKDLFTRYQNDQLTDEEKKACDYFQSHSNGELTEKDLETVSGGFMMDPVSLIIFCAVIIVVSTATTGGAIYAETKTRGRW